MQLKDIWAFFQFSIFAVPSRQEGNTPLFNPYHDEESTVDRNGASDIRRENLLRYLLSFPERPAVLMVGEAPGWRGCRFSGVPFTSEAQLAGDLQPFSGAPSSLVARPYREASATVFWQTMRPHHPVFFVWNCLPFHPHIPGNPLSNRHPTQKELDEHLNVLIGLMDRLRPRLVVAIGNTAQAVLARADIPALSVRHPSHGGVSKFRQDIDANRHEFSWQANSNPRAG